MSHVASLFLCLQEFMDEDEAALAAEGVTTAAAGSRGGAAGPGPGSSRDAAAAAAAAGASGQRSSKRKRVYEQHRPMSDINTGEQDGLLTCKACCCNWCEHSRAFCAWSTAAFRQFHYDDSRAMCACRCSPGVDNFAGRYPALVAASAAVWPHLPLLLLLQASLRGATTRARCV